MFVNSVPRDDLTVAAEGQIRSICESEEDTFHVSGDSQKTELILELLENETEFHVNELL